MEFKLNFDIPTSKFSIAHGDRMLLLGSCFSDAITPYFETAGFNVLSNPFGTLFHPSAMARAIRESIGAYSSAAVFKGEELYFSWAAAGKIHGKSYEKITHIIRTKRLELKEVSASAKVLFLTLGTAWGYRLKESGEIVANCHKAPSDLFEKELTSLTEMEAQWAEVIEELKHLNPSLNIVFTVSPVRHIKDGLIENNRSKARLLELAHRLSGRYSDVYYFPVYEIVMDELRDYRFFKSDFVHPSEQAVAYVWKKLVETYFSKDTAELTRKVEQINRELEHKSLYPDSEADRKRIDKLHVKQQQLSAKHPTIYWKQSRRT